MKPTQSYEKSKNHELIAVMDYIDTSVGSFIESLNMTTHWQNTNKSCIICLFQRPINIIRRFGVLNMVFNCHHGGEENLHNIESSTFSVKISYVISAYLLLTFIKCCHSLTKETLEVVILCKYLNITFISLFMGLSILTWSWQVNKLVLGMKLVYAIFQSVSESELEDTTHKRVTGMSKTYTCVFYLSMCCIAATVLPMVKFMTDGTDWAIAYQFVLFLCTMNYVLTICTALVFVILGISYVKKWKNKFENVMKEKMSGVSTFPHFVELIRAYGLLNRAFLVIFNYYNPSILLFAVGTTLEIICQLFTFILLAMEEHFEVGNVLTLLALSTFLYLAFLTSGAHNQLVS